MVPAKTFASEADSATGAGRHANQVPRPSSHLELRRGSAAAPVWKLSCLAVTWRCDNRPV